MSATRAMNHARIANTTPRAASPARPARSTHLRVVASIDPVDRSFMNAPFAALQNCPAATPATMAASTPTATAPAVPSESAAPSQERVPAPRRCALRA